MTIACEQEQQRTSNNDFVETDDVYDDACDLGQFCLNPCWFMFVKIQKLVQRNKQQNNTNKEPKSAPEIPSSPAGKPKKRSIWATQLQEIAYLVLIFGSWVVIFTKAYPLYLKSPHIPNYHMTCGYFVFVLCVTSWICAKWSNPGTITKDTLWKFDNYRYDGLLYRTNHFCPTMGIRKLARSKYDRYTGKHVPRFDHFCGWLNQSIGEENYRYFLIFLAVHTCMCLYGLVVTFRCLWGLAKMTQSVVSSSYEEDWSLFEKLVGFASVDYMVTGLFLLMVLMSLLLCTFLGFHLFLIFKGMTTNEFFKWKVLRERGQQQDHQSTSTRTIRGTSTSSSTERYLQSAALSPPAGSPPHHYSYYSSSSNNEDEETMHPSFNKSSSSSSSWKQAISIPGKNLYNLGIVANIHEIFFPRSLRRGRKDL